MAARRPLVVIGGSIKELPSGDSVIGASGSGDVVGSGTSVDLRIAVFDGTTGKLIKDGGKTIAELEELSFLNSIIFG